MLRRRQSHLSKLKNNASQVMYTCHRHSLAPLCPLQDFRALYKYCVIVTVVVITITMPKSWYLFTVSLTRSFMLIGFRFYFVLLFSGHRSNLIPAWGMLASDLGNATVARADLSRCLLSPYSIMWLRFVSGCGFSSNPTTSLICSYINTHYTHQSPASNVSVSLSVCLCPSITNLW